MRLIENIESVRLLACHPGEEGKVEGALDGETPDFCHVLACQRFILDQERDGVPAPHKCEVSARLADLSALQCGNRGGEQSQAVARRQLQPARDCQITAWPQMIKILLECLNCVDVALAQAVRACGRRRKGVKERD